MDDDNDVLAQIRAEQRAHRQSEIDFDSRITRSDDDDDMRTARQKVQTMANKSAKIVYRCAIVDTPAAGLAGSCVAAPASTSKTAAQRQQRREEGALETLGPFDTLSNCDAACDHRVAALRKNMEDASPQGEPDDDEVSTAVLQALTLTLAAILILSLFSKFFSSSTQAQASATSMYNLYTPAQQTTPTPSTLPPLGAPPLPPFII